MIPGSGLLGAEREGRQQVGADVQGEHLQHRDHQRDRAGRQRPHDERRQLGDVVGQVVGEEPLDVVERGAALLDRLHDVREVVVEQHEVRRLASDVGPGLAHRDADVGLAQGRRVVHPVAGHRDHLTALLQGARDPELLLGRDAREDERRASSGGLAECLVGDGELGAEHHRVCGDAGVTGDRHRGRRVVAGDHHDPDPRSPSDRDRIRDLGADRVGHPHEPEELHLDLGLARGLG